ncbi:tetratricopeptide repeat protein [Leptospira wolbachii serovar Codice str. CDC]|uniref:Tetratricopeptide repeat protein n=1 Tax=Leptospira wolbachii serovar Codice str. CDC TaxID=1218599 RepID=R9A608_9LEPT|nr:tetratricopeptide repeat protein [Leptospira wolbachii]EOQ97449.1 tetratricopeptide repeat protein [Leptospira wolbachii serovar Codice str. CDC]
MESVRKYLSLVFIFVILHTTLFAIDSDAMKEGKKAFSKKAYGEAIKKFTKHADSHPQDGEAYMYLGYIYEYKKDYPKSIQNFRRAADLDLDKDQRKTVLLKLALFFNYHQDWNLSATYAARYLKYDSKNEEVQKIYNRAVGNKGNPSSTQSYSHNVKVESKPSEAKQSDSKKDTSKKVEEVSDNAEGTKPSEHYEQVLVGQPNLEDVRWDYVLALFEEKKYDLAETNLKNLIEKNPSRSRYHYKLGIVKLRQDDPKSAIESFERAKKNPFSKDTNVFLYYVYLNEGIAYQKLAELDKAETSFQQAYKQLQKDPPLLALARLYEQKSDWENCISSADKALSLNPEQIESHIFRFVCMFEAGKRTKKFENSFAKYSEFIDSKYPDLTQTPEKYQVGFIKLARRYTETNAFEKAETYFSFLEKVPANLESREFLFYRGRNYFYSGKVDAAITILQKVSGSSSGYYLLARCYSKKGDLTKTKEQFKLAADLKPEYWTSESLEKDFKDVWKDVSFREFIKTKAGTVSAQSLP